MTIKATINAGLQGGNRSDSLDLHAARLYERATPVMAVVELLPVDRITPIDEASKKDPQVRLRIESLEVAPGGGAESTLRDLHKALYTSRTAAGTLGSDNEIQLAEQTVEHAAGVLSGHELARLRVLLDAVVDQARGILSHPKHRETDVRRLLGELLDKATAARDSGVQLDLNGAST
jgi:hypothetical protein